MAIPFYEPKAQVPEAAGDQVDGHGGHDNQPPAPQYAFPPTILNISGEITEIPFTYNATPATATGSGSASTSGLASGPQTTPAGAPTEAEQLEQALAWKILAIAMCKALKEYYMQPANSMDAFSSTSGILKILPNGKVHANWLPK